MKYIYDGEKKEGVGGVAFMWSNGYVVTCVTLNL